jgi:hypothetical protein
MTTTTTAGSYGLLKSAWAAVVYWFVVMTPATLYLI